MKVYCVEHKFHPNRPAGKIYTRKGDALRYLRKLGGAEGYYVVEYLLKEGLIIRDGE